MKHIKGAPYARRCTLGRSPLQAFDERAPHRDRPAHVGRVHSVAGDRHDAVLIVWCSGTELNPSAVTLRPMQETATVGI